MVAFDREYIDDQRSRVNGVALGPVRWSVFALLWERMGCWVSRPSIVQRVPGYFERPGTKESVKVHICNIRKALEGTPYAIETQYGMGYRLVKR